jgi:hypothetical protein
MENKTGTLICWVNEEKCILSFTPIDGFEAHEFSSSVQYWQFVMETVDKRHFRVQ